MKPESPSPKHSESSCFTPAYDEDWIESLTIHLSKDEASFLSQIEARVPLSLIGQILFDADLREQFLALASEWNFTTFADKTTFHDRFAESLRRIIAAARDF